MRGAEPIRNRRSACAQRYRKEGIAGVIALVIGFGFYGIGGLLELLIGAAFAFSICAWSMRNAIRRRARSRSGLPEGFYAGPGRSARRVATWTVILFVGLATLSFWIGKRIDSGSIAVGALGGGGVAGLLFAPLAGCYLGLRSVSDHNASRGQESASG